MNEENEKIEVLLNGRSYQLDDKTLENVATYYSKKDINFDVEFAKENFKVLVPEIYNRLKAMHPENTNYVTDHSGDPSDLGDLAVRTYIEMIANNSSAKAPQK